MESDLCVMGVFCFCVCCWKLEQTHKAIWLVVFDLEKKIHILDVKNVRLFVESYLTVSCVLGNYLLILIETLERISIKSKWVVLNPRLRMRNPFLDAKIAGIS